MRKRVVGPVGLEPTTGGLKGRTRSPYKANFLAPQSLPEPLPAPQDGL